MQRVDACRCERSSSDVYRCDDCGGAVEGFCDDSANVDALDGVVRVTDIAPTTRVVVPTGDPLIDDALGGGITEGGVYLLGGAPGVGKSTLLMEIARGMLLSGRRVLYVSAEESLERARERCERMGVLDDELLVSCECEIGRVLASVAATSADVVLLDSVQRLHDEGLVKAAGGAAQVRQVCERLISEKSRLLTVFLVGHVTKGGDLAGPKFLEHMVDVVLSLTRAADGGRELLVAKSRLG